MTAELDLGALLAEARSRIGAAEDDAVLRQVESDYLGKQGSVATLLGSIGALPKEDRGRVGAEANRVKRAIQQELEARREALAERALSAAAGGAFDATLPGARFATGSLHPLTRVVRELEDVFTSMGWQVLDGPEVEREYYNFDALNIPRDHPARDMFDTFWCKPVPSPRPELGGLLLRTHTSPVQVRAMERLAPPFRAVVPGRCFRYDTGDASHDNTFHQMEGLAVGEGLTVGHLIGVMRTFLREVFRRDIEVRLRPGFFPFVEPGFELDARCPFCTAGCSVCKRSTWLELCPCGMVHPAVLRHGGIDPERYTGFAFGLGLSRLVMLRYGIDDIRLLLSGDVRFLEQFA